MVYVWKVDMHTPSGILPVLLIQAERFLLQQLCLIPTTPIPIDETVIEHNVLFERWTVLHTSLFRDCRRVTVILNVELALFLCVTLWAFVRYRDDTLCCDGGDRPSHCCYMTVSEP